MSGPLGNFDAGAVVYGKFTTYRPSSGATYTLAGTPALSVYKDNSMTQSTTGVTLTADFDSVIGLNHFAIDTSADGTFYAAGSFYNVVITTGTVDSVSVTGSVVGSFTLGNTGAVTVTTNNDKTGYALSATGSAALTEDYRADGATGTLAQLLYEIVAHLGESSISGSTKTIKKIDGSTTAGTFTLSDASTPFSITRIS